MICSCNGRNEVKPKYFFSVSRSCNVSDIGGSFGEMGREFKNGSRFEIRFAGEFRALFPLTPALSLGERGITLSRFSKIDGVVTQSRAGATAPLKKFESGFALRLRPHYKIACYLSRGCGSGKI